MAGGQERDMRTLRARSERGYKRVVAERRGESCEGWIVSAAGVGRFARWRSLVGFKGRWAVAM
jgi:hypothetical protein